MSAEARALPKFQWDCDVPDTPFWENLDYRIGRNFLTCYNSWELDQLNQDFADKAPLPTDAKIRLLQSCLQARFDEKSAQYEGQDGGMAKQNYPEWEKLILGLSTLSHFLGSNEDSLHYAELMLANAPNYSKRMQAKFNMSYLLEPLGRFAEAEELAKEAYTWICEGEKLGAESPQGVGCARTIMRVCTKQGKWSEADEWQGKCDESLDLMARGRFVKYAESERRDFAEDVRALKELNKAEEGQDT